MAVNVELFDDLDAVERDADGALDRERQPCLFDRIAWYRLLAAHDQSGKPLVARARNGTATAWLFLSARQRELHSLTNWYSLRYASVHTGSEEKQANLLYKLAQNLRSTFPRIAFGPIGEDSPLPAAFRTAGWVVKLQPMTIGWDIDTAGRDFEAYWADRPGQLRSTAKRKAKAAGLDIEIHTRFDDGAWADYEAVNRESWKPE